MPLLPRLRRPWLALVPLVALSACTVMLWQARFAPLDDYANLDLEAPFLKVHTLDGGVYVLLDWQIDGGAISGSGLRYDDARQLVGEGPHEIGPDEVALLETNRPETVIHSGHAAMGVVTGASILVTAICLTNPKACFGSCPTFYADDGTGLALQAEGFSDSVTRVLEQTDVDAMATAVSPGEGPLHVLLTNEALETHLIRGVDVLAVPRPAGGRVFRAGDVYRPATLVPAATCASDLGDCRDLLRDLDASEYLSPTDPDDLAAKETIELTFPRPDGEAGLVVGARNSLVTTFVLYQMLAYMGTSAGEWMMLADRHGDAVLDEFAPVGLGLGDVEVELWTGGEWANVGKFEEVGPIAREVQLVPFPAIPEGDVRVRLIASKGSWRIDQVALAELGPAVEPLVVPVAAVHRDGVGDLDALAALRDPNGTLVTYPEDAYDLTFDLPPGDWELFLRSRGWYVEWIREQWLPEQDPTQVAAVIADPPGALRRLAPEYKRIEDDVERVFWESRIGTHP